MLARHVLAFRSKLQSFLTHTSTHAKCSVATGSSGDGFVVRCADSAKDLRYIQEKARKEGWVPGVHDLETYHAFDPSGFLIGELDGTKISCVSAIKFNDEFSQTGFYFVDEAHRGKGYGIRTFRAGMASVGENSNTLGDGLLHLIPFYEKYGLIHQGCNICRYWIASSKVVQAFSKVNPVAESHPSVVIKPINEVDFENLAAFDHSICLIQRRSFLEKWISPETGLGWAAVTPTGEVLGYTVTRRALCRGDQQYAWRFRPVFAESVSIAKSLIYSAAQTVSAKAPEESLILDVILEGNPGAMEIVQEVEGVEGNKTRRLFSKQVLPYPTEKIFGLTLLA